jgi:hypothetical protein
MALNVIERALSLNGSCATAHYFAALVNAFADNRRPQHSTQTAPSGSAPTIFAPCRQLRDVAQGRLDVLAYACASFS